MRLMWKENVYGWRMTGILGAYARWFFGFSIRPDIPKDQPARQKEE